MACTLHILPQMFIFPKNSGEKNNLSNGTVPDPLFVKGWRLESIEIMHHECRYCCDHHSSLELASSMGQSQLFNVACWKIQVGAPGMWSHVHHTMKPFKLVARNVQIHSDLWLLPCDMWYTNFVYQALSLIACSTRKAGNRDYHGARKAVTHNNIQFLHNINLADATSNYTNYAAASGQVT